MKNKNYLKSPWSVSFGAVIFSFFLTMLNNHFKNKPILSTVLPILKAICNFIVLVLNFKLKVWWLIIVIIIIIVIFYLIINFKEEKFKPNFCSYKNDIFKQWKWSWGWERNSYDIKWHISDLKAHCPRCDTPLINCSSNYELFFECPRCDFKAKESQCEEPQKIELLILDNVNRKQENKKMTRMLIKCQKFILSILNVVKFSSYFFYIY